MSKKLLLNNVITANEIFPPIGEYTIMEIVALNKTYTSFDATEVTELYVDEVLTTPTNSVRFQGLGLHTIKFKGNVSRFDLIESCTIKQLSPTTTTLFRLFGQKDGSGYNSLVAENFVFGNIYNEFITSIKQLFSYVEPMGEQATVTIEHLNLPQCKDATTLFRRARGKSGRPIENVIISDCFLGKGVNMYGLFDNANIKNVKIINSTFVTNNMRFIFSTDEEKYKTPLTVDFTGTTFLSEENGGIDISYIFSYRNIQEIDLRCVKGNISNMYGCFKDCTNLKKVDLRGWKFTPHPNTDAQCFNGVPSDCVVLVDNNFPFTEQEVGFTGTFTRG